MASLHSVGIWFIHERCRVALDFFYYVVMHSAFISDGLMPCTSLTILDCSATVCIIGKATCAVAVTERATSTVAVNGKSI